MKHESIIVPGSIEDLGMHGIAFSVMCCGDPKTVERHTLQHAHTMTAEDLLLLIQREYLQTHAETHQAAQTRVAHMQKLAESGLVVGSAEECEGCQ